MHELAVTRNILELAERHGAEAGAARVTDIYLVIGALSSIVDDSVRFYWDLIAEGSICEGAALHFERIPAKFVCLDCECIYAIENEISLCPACESARVRLLQGDEFRLDQIEIEKEEKLTTP